MGSFFFLKENYFLRFFKWSFLAFCFFVPVYGAKGDMDGVLDPALMGASDLLEQIREQELRNAIAVERLEELEVLVDRFQRKEGDGYFEFVNNVVSPPPLPLRDLLPGEDFGEESYFLSDQILVFFSSGKGFFYVVFFCFLLFYGVFLLKGSLSLSNAKIYFTLTIVSIKFW